MSEPLSQLVQASTQAEALALELAVCTAFGLPTTAWQPVQAIPAVLNTNAQVAADASSIIALTAQGGFASYAALMVDSSGNPITSWMDLVLQNVYGIARQPATAATGSTPVLNSSGNPHSWSPSSPLRFANTVSGASYTTTGSGTIAAAGTTTVNIQADASFVGSIGTSGAGVTLIMTTPLPGVAPQPLTVSLVGSDAESNSAALMRAQGKIAAISPSGASQAYNFIATSIPQGIPSAVPPFAISAVITRVTTHASPGSGIVQVIVANAGGAPNATDLNVVNQAIQTQVVPSGVSANVQDATTFSLVLSYLVVVKSSSNLTATQVTTNIEDALANLCATFPIGGYNSGIPGFTNYIPFGLILETIMSANIGSVDCALAPFAGSGGLSGQILVTDVPVLAVPTGSVDFIQG